MLPKKTNEFSARTPPSAEIEPTGAEVGLAQIADFFNSLHSVAEPLVVLGMTLLVSYVAYRLAFASDQAHQAHSMELVKGLNDNWKAALILLVVLFYRTVRMFLEQAEEAFGVKRRLPGEPREEPFGVKGRLPGEPREETTEPPEGAKIMEKP
jgi:hypothetical protein